MIICLSVTMVMVVSFQALEEAYKTIELLFDRIKNISEKAERSEQTVSSCHYTLYYPTRSFMYGTNIS